MRSSWQVGQGDGNAAAGPADDHAGNQDDELRERDHPYDPLVTEQD
jgi:hypothetical protein